MQPKGRCKMKLGSQKPETLQILGCVTRDKTQKMVDLWGGVPYIYIYVYLNLPMSVIFSSCRLPRVYLKSARFKKRRSDRISEKKKLFSVWSFCARVPGNCAFVAGMCARCAAWPVSSRKAAARFKTLTALHNLFSNGASIPLRSSLPVG